MLLLLPVIYFIILSSFSQQVKTSALLSNDANRPFAPPGGDLVSVACGIFLSIVCHHGIILWI